MLRRGEPDLLDTSMLRYIYATSVLPFPPNLSHLVQIFLSADSNTYGVATPGPRRVSLSRLLESSATLLCSWQRLVRHCPRHTSASHPEAHTVEMVYCGKPSKGCSNCRGRKIRVSPLFDLSTRVPSQSIIFPGWLRSRVRPVLPSLVCGTISPSDDATIKTKH